MIAFLFGAGASYGSLSCVPSPPPLGTRLFDALESLGGVAHGLPKTVKARFRERFEDGMADLYRSNHRLAYAFQREMALFFLGFGIGDNNLYTQLLSALLNSNRAYTLATTNYDLLIEYALVSLGRTPNMEPNVDPNHVVLRKLHGSCNYIPALNGVTFENVDLHAPVGAALSSGINYSHPAEAASFCRTQKTIAPAMAMYTMGKEMLFCPEQLQEHQRAWREAAEMASANIVIGLKVEEADNHIWDPLARSNGPLYYVGLRADIDSWTQHHRKFDVHWISETFEGAMPEIIKLINYK
jgi:hypothetical protein